MMKFVAGIIVGIALTVGGVSGLVVMMDMALDTTRGTFERMLNGKSQNDSR
jgi:hypothetical protein